MNDIEFKVNQYILLRLEGKYTVIYMNGKRFMYCKRLLLNIPKKDVDYFNGIGSIDEVSELYDQYLMDNEMYKEENGELHPSLYSYDIPPETEFWGHCSNIQAWVEFDYDTRILHSNLAFPLLKELTKAGDPRAKKIFKEEIALRFLKGKIITKKYLVKEKYLNYLNKGELVCIFEDYWKLLEISIYTEDTAKEARFMIKCSLKYLDNTACKEILERYKKFLKDKKSIKEIHVELGLIYIKDLKYEEAIKLYEFVLNYDSNDIEVLTELGILYRLNQKFKKSVQVLYQALEIETGNFFALIQLGTTFKDMKKYKDAIETFRQAREIDPSNILALCKLAITFEEMQKYKKAIRTLKKAQKIDAINTEILDILGGIYYDLKKYNKSIKIYKRAVSLNVEKDWFWYRLGSNYRKINQLDKAIDAYMKAYRINPRGYLTLYALIKTFYKKRDYTWTELFCRQILYFYPNSCIAIETLNKIACDKSEDINNGSKDSK